MQRIGAKARFTLGRLVTFFNVLLGGFLVGRAIKTIEALVKGDGEALKNIGDTIIKQLTAAGGIFVAINGGMLIALRSLTKLASFLTQVAVNNLILKPIRLVFSIARAAAAAIIGGAAGGLPLLGAPPLAPKGKVRGIRKGLGVGLRGITYLEVGKFIGQSQIAAGDDPSDVNKRINTGLGFALGGEILSFLADRQGVPPRIKASANLIRVLGIGLGFATSQRTFDRFLGIRPEQTNQLINQSVEQIRIRQGDPEINILPEVRTQESAPMSVEGRAALLMFVEPFNKKNPYVLNSYVQYNVIPV